jgi:hypothetical protein
MPVIRRQLREAVRSTQSDHPSDRLGFVKLSHFGNKNVSTNRAPQAGAPSGRTAQYFAIAAMLIGWLPILST